VLCEKAVNDIFWRPWPVTSSDHCQCWKALMPMTHSVVSTRNRYRKPVPENPYQFSARSRTLLYSVPDFGTRKNRYRFVWHTCRKLVQVFWYGFSVPVSGACVIGISALTTLTNYSTDWQAVALTGKLFVKGHKRRSWKVLLKLNKFAEWYIKTTELSKLAITRAIIT